MPAASAAADGHASGGTVQQTSPGTPSRTRLVTTMRSPGTVPSRAVTRLAASSRSDSAPSSTSSRGDSASAARSESVSATPGWSCTPSVDASAGASERGSRTDSSGRNTTSAAGRLRRITSAASRVLPAPPGPTRLTSRALAEHRGQLGQFLFPADEARLRERQWRALRAGRGPGTGLGRRTSPGRELGLKVRDRLRGPGRQSGPARLPPVHGREGHAEAPGQLFLAEPEAGAQRPQQPGGLALAALLGHRPGLSWPSGRRGGHGRDRVVLTGTSAAQPTNSDSVSAMQAALDWPWTSTLIRTWTSDPRCVCLMSVSVAVALIFEPTGTGAGNRTRSRP